MTIEILAMPVSGGMESLREKLHARMSQLHRGGGEAGGNDDLLEDRTETESRKRRRKETRKIRSEEEITGMVIYPFNIGETTRNLQY